MKKTTLLIGASIVGVLAYGLTKANGLKGLFSNIKVSLDRINSVNYNSGNILLNIAVSLENQTNIGTALTELVTLKELRLFNEAGKLLAVSTPNVTGISFNPNQTIYIDNIEVHGTLASALREYLETEFKGNYKIQATIEVLGKSWVLS